MKMKISDPKVIVDIDMSSIKDTVEDSAHTYEDMYLSNNIYCNLVVISSIGLFTFIPFKEKPDISISTNIQKFFEINNANLYIFFVSDDKNYLLDSDKKNLIELDNLYQAFDNIYNNLFRPIVDQMYIRFQTRQDLLKIPETPEQFKASDMTGQTYEQNGQTYQIDDDFGSEDTGDINAVKEPLSEQNVNRLCLLCGKLENNTRPEANKRIDADGTVYVKKYVSKRIGDVDTGLIAGEAQWIPVADIDTDKLILKAAFGGFFGLHKFAMGNILQGVIYFLTAGCCGVLPFFDILSFLTGSAVYKVADYNDGDKLTKEETSYIIPKPKHKGLAIICAFISLAIGYLMMKYVYINIAQIVISLLSSGVQNMSSEQQGNIIDKALLFTEK